MKATQPVARWIPLADAADQLGTPIVTLRRMFDRHSKKIAGGVEATVDGIRARRLGRQWRVLLGTWGAS